MLTEGQLRWDSNIWNNLTVCKKKKKWYKLELLVLDSSVWNHQSEGKQSIDIKYNYWY